LLTAAAAGRARSADMQSPEERGNTARPASRCMPVLRAGRAVGLTMQRRHFDLHRRVECVASQVSALKRGPALDPHSKNSGSPHHVLRRVGSACCCPHALGPHLQPRKSG
jgi:hypothetical protein